MADELGAPREGVFAGGLPYLALGHGEPLIYLPGGTPNHQNPPPGFQRQLTLRTVRPFARAGFDVFFTNRWPGMSIDITWPEVAAVHATALAEHFGRPVHVLGHSTGGSIVMQLIADHPEVVRACGSSQRGVHTRSRRSPRTAQYVAELGDDGPVRRRGTHRRDGASPWLRAALRPLLRLASRRINIENPTDTMAMIKAEDGFDVRSRLPGIQTETLVICGAKDGFWPLEMFAETAYRMPHGRLIMYPELGHNLVTSPRFVADVVAFLHNQEDSS